MPKPKQTQQQGYVSDATTYTLDALCEVLGVEERTIREARAHGLPTRLVGGRRMVISGAEFNEWIKTAPMAPVPKKRADYGVDTDDDGDDE